jgi:uncharacterized protein YktB (UPF0637 family)
MVTESGTAIGDVLSNDAMLERAWRRELWCFTNETKDSVKSCLKQTDGSWPHVAYELRRDRAIESHAAAAIAKAERGLWVTSHFGIHVYDAVLSCEWRTSPGAETKTKITLGLPERQNIAARRER